MKVPKEKTVLIIQARMGSTRLPGKVLMPLMGQPMLSFLLQRLKHVRLIDQIVVATTILPQDDAIVTCCKTNDVTCFRGSEKDVLDRYKKAAESVQASIVVRITADCPLIDPGVIDSVITAYTNHQPDCAYASNTVKRTYPRGMDVEVFSCQTLKQMAESASQPDEREHVTPYIHHHPELFHSIQVYHKPDTSKHRWTVDTPEDYALITKLTEALYPTHPQFTLQDLLSISEKHPEWETINAHVQQTKG